MYLPSSHLRRSTDLHQKREEEIPPGPDSLITNAYNNVDLIIGVVFVVVVVLGLLLRGLITRSCLRGSKPKSDSSPAETQTASRPPSFSPYRPSNAGSDSSEFTLCADSPNGPAKELGNHVSRPPSALAAPCTLVPPFGSRPLSTLSVATTTSQCTVKTERSSSWESIAQRLDEKAGARESKRISTASAPHMLLSVPPSPRTPTSPSSPIPIPSPVSLKDSKRHIYGSK